MIKLIFSCGKIEFTNGNDERQPKCKDCGAGLMRVIAPPPRFQGVGTSPLKKVRNASR